MVWFEVSDRDKIFTSKFWQEVFKRTGTSLQMSTTYHPQSDGQTECVNQQIECFLRCFINSQPKQWSKWLPLCEFWYNTNWHSALGNSPFEVLYGHAPRYFGLTADDSLPMSDAQQWINQRASIQDAVRQHLLRAKQRMKSQADKNSTERDKDMASPDTTKIIARKHMFQVISSTNNLIYYFYNIDQNTTPCFILRRIICDMYKPRVKMRESKDDYFDRNTKAVYRGEHTCTLPCTCNVYKNYIEGYVHALQRIMVGPLHVACGSQAQKMAGQSHDGACIVAMHGSMPKEPCMDRSTRRPGRNHVSASLARRLRGGRHLLTRPSPK